MTQFPQKRMEYCPAFYRLLDLAPTASVEQIRRAYRLKSKLYHPDTTVLPAEIAVRKFRELNEVYAILSDPERRHRYDVSQAAAESTPMDQSAKGSIFQQGSNLKVTTTPYLDLKERPLSPGEIFALFLLGVTFLACLALAIILGVARGEMAIQPTAGPTATLPHALPAIIAPEDSGRKKNLSLVSKNAPAINSQKKSAEGPTPLGLKR